jgi:DNA-binding Lrp family transcriptional regulator
MDYQMDEQNARSPGRRRQNKGANSSPYDPDEIDLKILAALQQDGRITNIDLAAKIGISPPPCLRRKQSLEAFGYILGYHAEIDAAKLGYDILAFIFVGLVSQTDENIRSFEAALRNWPMVREAYVLSGSVDFLLRCVAPNLKEFQHFVAEAVMKSPRVSTVKTALTMHARRRLRFFVNSVLSAPAWR